MFWMGLFVGSILGFSIGTIVIAMIVACGDDENSNIKNNNQNFIVEEIEEVWIDNGKVIG